MAWFRMLYARNAFLRSLDQPLDSLSLAGGVDAMNRFMTDFRPQHAELDAFECSWGPVHNGVEFTLTRRMLRHVHPETALNLVFEFASTPARAGLRGTAPGGDAKTTQGYRALSRATVRAIRLG